MKKNVRRLLLLMAATIVILIPVRIYASEIYELDSDDYSKIADIIRDQIANGELDSEEDVDNIINTAEDMYGIEISDSDRENAIKVFDTMNDLGIDKERVVEVFDDVYDKVIVGKQYENAEDMVEAIEDQIIDSATDKMKEVVKENVKKSFSDYFKAFVDRIKEFIEKIKELWLK